jgi:hypothetical protein
VQYGCPIEEKQKSPLVGGLVDVGVISLRIRIVVDIVEVVLGPLCGLVISGDGRLIAGLRLLLLEEPEDEPFDDRH